MGKSNYEIAVERTRPLFLTYDQSEMIEKFGLEHDEDYLYLNCLNRPYRIGRHTGVVEWSEDGFANCTEAAFYDAMTIYDVLGYSKEGCHLSGRYTTIGGMKFNHTFQSGHFDNMAAYLNGKTSRFNHACVLLGGVEEQVGDAAWRLPLFPFLPVIVQLWEADEEFPPSLRILWDENIIDFMHFETTFYASGYMLDRIRQMMEGTGSGSV